MKYEKLTYTETKSGRKRWRKQYKHKEFVREQRAGETKPQSYRRCVKEFEAWKAEVDANDKPSTLESEMLAFLAKQMELCAARHDFAAYLEVSRVKQDYEMRLRQGNPLPSLDTIDLHTPKEETRSEQMQRIAYEKRQMAVRGVRDQLGTSAPWEDEPEPIEPSDGKFLDKLIQEFLSKHPSANKARLNNLLLWAGPIDPAHIDGRWWQDYFRHVENKTKTKEWATSYGRSVLSSAQQFIKWLERSAGAIENAPKNLEDFNINLRRKKVSAFTLEQVLKYLEEAKGRTRLYILLTLNCGMTAIDIADLTDDEVDWKRGRITRQRSKTRERSDDVPTVSYQLWDETFTLLKEFRDQSRQAAEKYGRPYDTVLLTQKGTPVCTRSKQGGSRNDSVRLAFKRLCEKIEKPGSFLMLKKTSASLIKAKFKRNDLAQLFLGHVPGTVAEGHYVEEPEDALDESLEWLSVQYGLTSN